MICNFDCVRSSAATAARIQWHVRSGRRFRWSETGRRAGAWHRRGNGTQDTGGSFNAWIVISPDDTVTIRMSATGGDPSVGVQFYMQTASGFNYQSLNDTLIIDGAFHDIVFPLAGITDRRFVDTNGVNLFSHAGDLSINVDSVIYSVVPEPASLGLVGLAVLTLVRRKR